jgi:hypothetical protein
MKREKIVLCVTQVRREKCRFIAAAYGNDRGGSIPRTQAVALASTVFMKSRIM